MTASMTIRNDVMRLLGLWAARAGAARPRCPRVAPPPGTRSGRRPGPLAPGQRWSLARKHEVVLRLLRGEPAELLSRELGLPVSKLERWRQKARLASRARSRSARPIPPATNSPRPCSGSASSAWRSSCCARGWGGPAALWPGGGRGDGCQPISPATGRHYGVARVCQVWDVPRSSFYAARQAAAAAGPAKRLLGAGRSRRSPTTPCSPPSGTTSPARPGPARGTERSGPACG